MFTFILSYSNQNWADRQEQLLFSRPIEEIDQLVTRIDKLELQQENNNNNNNHHQQNKRKINRQNKTK